MSTSLKNFLAFLIVNLILLLLVAFGLAEAYRTDCYINNNPGRFLVNGDVFYLNSQVFRVTNAGCWPNEPAYGYTGSLYTMVYVNNSYVKQYKGGDKFYFSQCTRLGAIWDAGMECPDMGDADGDGLPNHWDPWDGAKTEVVGSTMMSLNGGACYDKVYALQSGNNIVHQAVTQNCGYTSQDYHNAIGQMASGSLPDGLTWQQWSDDGLDDFLSDTDWQVNDPESSSNAFDTSDTALSPDYESGSVWSISNSTLTSAPLVASNVNGTGFYSGSGSTDNQYLDDIAQNTRKSLESQKGIADYLASIDSKIGNQGPVVIDQSSVDDLAEKIGSSVGESINGTLGGTENGTGENGTSEDVNGTWDSLFGGDVATLEGEVDSWLAGQGVPENGTWEFKESDVPSGLSENASKGWFDQKFNEFLGNENVQGIEDGVGVTVTSPTSSFTWVYKGSSIVFDFGRWDSTLTMFGTLLLGLAYLSAAIIVLRA